MPMPPEDFYDYMMKVDAPDNMMFQITSARKDDEITFSMQSVEAIAEQFRNFLLARTLAQYHLTGIGPKRLQAHVQLRWTAQDEDDLQQGDPWYEVRDRHEGLTRVDADNMFPRLGG